MKELENSQFFQHLGHSEDTFDFELGSFFRKKRASDLVPSSAALRCFYFTETFQSQKLFMKVHTENVVNRQKFRPF